MESSERSQTALAFRRPSVLLAAVSAVAIVAGLTIQSAFAAGPAPIPVTPFSGFSSLLTRAPYATDLTQTSADVSWGTSASAAGTLEWGPLGNCTDNQTSVPSTLPTLVPASGSPPSATGREFTVNSTSEYQSTVVLTGLSPSTTYCYRPVSAGPSSVDLLGTNPSQDFTTLDPVGSSNPLTFDVVGDLGETLYSSTTAFPNNLNTDQAAIDSLIGSSGAKFVVTAGDVAYSGGTQANYGDLDNGGSEISDIFGPSYWPQTKGLPVFPGEGNHGQNVIGLRTWPESNGAAASGGTYAFDSYPAPTQDGTNPGSYPDDWYAISDGDVRIYVLDGAWADGSNVGTATGAACTAAGEEACPGYQVDHDEHWLTSSPEYKWLAADLADHPNTIKLAVWHYPLRSDEDSQDSDVYLQNSPSNPDQSSSLESLLSANGVKVVFNGHAHTYQRIAPTAAGQITNYVTGGGGGVLEPVSTGSPCTAFKSAGSIYALGWSPTSNTGTACGTGVPTPQSAAQVYNFLKVTVNGGTMTVTPINAAGQSFDVQSYTYPVTTTPTTSVLVPSSGSTLSGTATTLDATASNATSVEFWLFGGSYGYSGKMIGTATSTRYGWLYSWNTTTVPNASYALLSEAFNDGSSAFSAGVNITVSNPLTTSVLVPATGATLSGGTTLDASASNATSVEFWLFGGSYGYSGKMIGTATSTRYGWLYSWNTTTVPNASYALLSEAFNDGSSAFSAGVNITVDN